MADVTIKYNGRTIADMSQSGTKTAKTGGKYLSNDLVVEYSRPSTSPRLQTKTVNPSLSQQNISPDYSYEGMSSVVVNAITKELLANLDGDFLATNIRKNVNLFGLTGSYEGSSAGAATPILQAKSATPSLSQQTITPDYGKDGLSSVTVAAITKALLQSLDADFVATNIKKGVDLFGLVGTYEATGSGGGGTDESSVGVGTANKMLSAASSSIQFSEIVRQPTSFVVISKGNLATGSSPYKAAVVVFDGANVFGQYITNTSNAQMTYSSTDFSQSYSNGTLTINANGANFQANQYLLIYSYGGSASDIKTANVQVGSGVTQIAFTGLTAEPKYFSCVFKSNFSTASGYARANAIVSDGENISGLYMGTADTASTSSWTSTYADGTLTIRSASTSNGGYFHQPGYYQLTYVV